MKKTLLYLIIPMLFASASVNSQIKVWDFGGETVANFGSYTFQNMISPTAMNTWYGGTVVAGTTGVTLPASLDITTGLLRWAGGVNSDRLRVLDTNISRYDTGASAGTADYSYLTGRMYVNSSSGTGRGLFITLTAGQQITVIARADADGSTLNFNTQTAPLNLAMTEYHFTATTAGEYQLFASTGGKVSYYRLYLGNVTTPTTALGVKSFQKVSDVNVYSKESKIFLSNIKSKTQVSVYNVLGALVKSINADGDVSLDINGGVYIVNAKSADGAKSVKVIVQ